MAELRRRVGELEQFVVGLTKAEAALKESEEKFRNVFDCAMDGILIVDSETKRILTANKKICELLGYTPAEIALLRLEDIHPAEDLPYALEQFEKQTERKITLAKDIPLRCKDGRIFFTDVNASPLSIRGGIYLMGIYRDITERRTVEDQISNLAKFPSEDPDPVLRVTGDGIVLYANWASRPLLSDWNSGIGKTVPERWRSIIQGVLASGSREQAETTVKGRTLSLAVTPVVEAKYVNIYGRDITDRKKMEVELRKSEERFDLAVKGANDGLWDWLDVRGDGQWWSSRFYGLLGYADGEIRASHSAFCSLLHPEDSARYQDAVRDHFQKRIPFDMEFRLQNKSGEYRWFRGRGQAIWDDAGQPLRISGSIQDITERKNVEEEAKKHLKELEIFYKASFGREERILELKAVIDRLEKELVKRQA